MDDKDLQTPSPNSPEPSDVIPRNIIMPGRKTPASFVDPDLERDISATQPQIQVSPVNTIPVRKIPDAAPDVQTPNVSAVQTPDISEAETEVNITSTNVMPVREVQAAEPATKSISTSAIPLREIPVITPKAETSQAALSEAISRPVTERLSYEPTVEQVAPQGIVPDIEIPTLRTYKNDIGRTVETDKITTAKILLAEQKKQEKQAAFVPETSVRKPKNILALLLGLLLTVGTVGVLGFFAYTKLVPQTPEISFNTSSFFLFAFDKEEFVDVARSKADVYASVDQIVASAMQNKESTYTDIIFYKTDPTTKAAARITTADFFRLYEVELPTNIERSISTDFAYGLYKTETSVEPFVVIGLVDFENAFDSMFAWEPTLAIDMKEFFPKLMQIFADNPEVPSEIPIVVSTTTATSTATTTKPFATSTASTSATSTATTTAPAYKPINRNVQFTDVVLANRDTRAIRDENGTPYFYYTFIDRDKILFAQDPALIPDIVRKIREKQLVR